MPASHQERTKPNPGFKISGHKAWVENWEQRMAADKTRVEVHLSTDPSTEPWDSWEIAGEPDDVFRRVLTHMLFRRRHGTLQPGLYCVRVPGHVVHKHSFEVA